MSDAVYLNDVGVVSALGAGKDATWRAVSAPTGRGLVRDEVMGQSFWLGRVPRDLYSRDLPPEFENRVNAILAVALDEVKTASDAAIQRYGAERVACLIGSCDNGSETSLEALRARLSAGAFPPGYALAAQRADLPARFARYRTGAFGPAVSFSTACASSASAIASARNMIRAGLCDAAIVGGADIVSAAVALGFASLEAVSPDPCLPFSINRRGISLGEGAAVFVMSRDPLSDATIELLGVGESADASHMTAPHPEGIGAARAMSLALADAGLEPEDVDYVNLHGTGTELNDAMEAKATARVFPRGVPASSTKSLTGHALGAAGAIELAICWLALSSRNAARNLPVQIWDGIHDPAIPALDIVDAPRSVSRLETCVSNSFAFGGCNVSLAIGRR